MEAEDILKVTCCIFPNADVYWFESEKGKDYLKKVIDKWKSQHQEYDETGTDMAVAQIHMVYKDYLKIGATIESRDFFKNL